MASTIAFNTANLVARVTEWRFELQHWGEQDKLTRERTDEREWADICASISAAGYRAVEIWGAHVEPSLMTDERAATYRKVLTDNGLTPIGLAGAMTGDTVRVCQQLGIPAVNGGYWGSDVATTKRLLAASTIAFNYENHPEKSAAEIREKIEPLEGRGGIALDTGWLGTSGLDGPSVVRELRSLIRHVHLKDVKAHGGHLTCRLGEGVVGIPAVIQALKEIGYRGAYSWEDEPEDRNPMEISREMREYIEGLV